MEDYKLNWVEKKTYKVMYNTIEKLLNVCYSIYLDGKTNEDFVKTYEDFCNLVNDMLKGK